MAEIKRPPQVPTSVCNMVSRGVPLKEAWKKYDTAAAGKLARQQAAKEAVSAEQEKVEQIKKDLLDKSAADAEAKALEDAKAKLEAEAAEAARIRFVAEEKAKAEADATAKALAEKDGPVSTTPPVTPPITPPAG